MIIGLIPARSGSKRVKDKNIRPLGGYPLMAWSIAAARILLIPVYVSSENEEYLRIARHYGAISHLRSPEAASDTAKDEAVIDDFTGKARCARIMFLRPTTPLRDPVFLSQMVSLPSEFHWVSLTKMRDGDFYRNTGFCEIFNSDAFGKNKAGVIQENEVGEIDTEDDFDYIEWRLSEYGSPVYDYLKSHFPILSSV